MEEHGVNPTDPASRNDAGTRGVLSSLFQDKREGGRRTRRVIGFVVGFVLLAGAVIAVVRNAGPIEAAFNRVSSGAWWLLPALLCLPLVHVPLTGLVFWAATPPGADGRARVGVREMTALIAMGNLANYLPLRPGMVARIAYHRAVNGISVVESAKILGTVVASGLGAACLLVAAALAAAQSSGGTIPLLPVAVLCLPVAVGLLGVIYFREDGSVIASAPSRWWLVVTLRYVDLAAWSVRYALAFWAIGITLTPAQAALYAVVANVAMLIPIAGNGLGIREWVVGLVGPLLPGTILGASTIKAEGLSADLLNRSAEVITSIALGTLGGWWMTRHVKARAERANSGSAGNVEQVGGG